MALALAPAWQVGVQVTLVWLVRVPPDARAQRLRAAGPGGRLWEVRLPG